MSTTGATSGPRFFAAARDEVRARTGPGDYDLEIVSRLPKDHWTANVMEIVYAGESYVLVDRAKIGGYSGEPERHRFRLKKIEHELFYTGSCEYFPEEVREIYRQKCLETSAMWVEGLPFLWGFLDETRQRGLERLFDHDPRRATGWSLVFGGILGTALALSNAMLRHAWSQFGFSPGALYSLLLVFGVYLVAETAWRAVQYKDGRIRGSLFGTLLGPAADRFLRWENWPGSRGRSV